MCISEVLLLDLSEVIHLCECEVLSLSACKHRCTLCRIKELTLLVEELEGVPLLRVMRSCKDDTSVSLFENHSHLCRRSRAESSLHNVNAASDQCSAHKVLDHVAGKTCVLTYNDLIALSRRLWSALAHLLAISVSELYNVKRRESLARCTADCSADA